MTGLSGQSAPVSSHLPVSLLKSTETVLGGGVHTEHALNLLVKEARYGMTGCSGLGVF